jgi:hypothetical protein
MLSRQELRMRRVAAGIEVPKGMAAFEPMAAASSDHP